MSILETTKLSVRFGGLTAVSDLNIKLQQGELVGMIGPNGSGKTTAFNTITGFYRPTEGRIYFDGHDITGRRPDEIAALGLARIFQQSRLFKQLSLLDNVRIGFHLRRESSPLAALVRTPGYVEEEKRIHEESLALIEMLKLADHMHEKAGGLSYGLQRKAEVARALATKPRLLLLDEPACGLSAQNISQLMEFIVTILQDFNLTIFLIEHTMRVIMGICPRVIVLHKGSVIADGRPEEICRDPLVVEAYLGADAYA